MITKEDLLALIPVYKSGDKAGMPLNEELRDTKRIILTYKLDQNELSFLKFVILFATPESVLKRRAKESASL